MKRLWSRRYGFAPMLAVLQASTLVVLVIAAGAAEAGSGAKLVVKGNPAAWAEIKAALTKFHALKTYRAKGTLPGGSAFTMDVVQPDRFRTRMKVAGMSIETVTIGRDVRFRQGDGPWMCAGQPSVPPETNPANMAGEVTAAKGPAAVIAGVNVRSYTYAWKRDGQSTRFKLFVGNQNGLPKRLQVLDGKGKVRSQFDYFDYNVPVSIQLPACP